MKNTKNSLYSANLSEDASIQDLIPASVCPVGTLSDDTNRKAEKYHIELIRKASPAKRLHLVNSLIHTTRHLSWLGICERYPDDSLEQRRYRYLLLIYGNEKMAKEVSGMLVEAPDEI